MSRPVVLVAAALLCASLAVAAAPQGAGWIRHARVVSAREGDASARSSSVLLAGVDLADLGDGLRVCVLGGAAAGGSFDSLLSRANCSLVDPHLTHVSELSGTLSVGCRSAAEKDEDEEHEAEPLAWWKSDGEPPYEWMISASAEPDGLLRGVPPSVLGGGGGAWQLLFVARPQFEPELAECMVRIVTRAQSRGWPLRWLTSPLSASSSPSSSARVRLERGEGARGAAAAHAVEAPFVSLSLRPASRPQTGRPYDSELLNGFLESRALSGKFMPPVIMGMAGAVVMLLMKPLMQAVEPMIIPQLSNELTNNLQGSTDTGNVEPVVEITSPAVARNVSHLVVDAVAFYASHEVTRQLVESMAPRMATVVADAVFDGARDRIDSELTATLSASVQDTVPDQMARSLPILLTEQLTPAVTHSVVSALSHTLQDLAPVSYFCQQCRERRMWCDYCKMSDKSYYSSYYGTYYAGYYSRYYTPYYVEALKKLDEVQNS